MIFNAIQIFWQRELGVSGATMAGCAKFVKWALFASNFVIFVSLRHPRRLLCHYLINIGRDAYLTYEERRSR